MKYYKTGQAAKVLGVHPDTVKRWVRSGKLFAVKTPGGRNLIPVLEIEKILTLSALKDFEQEQRQDIAEIERQIEVMKEKIRIQKEGK